MWPKEKNYINKNSSEYFSFEFFRLLLRYIFFMSRIGAYNSQAESGQVGGQKNIASADTKIFFSVLNVLRTC